jgi:hypothetical protein
MWQLPSDSHSKACLRKTTFPSSEKTSLTDAI